MNDTERTIVELGIEKRELQEASDEWFINNLVGLIKAELTLAKKFGRPVNREKLAEWINIEIGVAKLA